MHCAKLMELLLQDLKNTWVLGDPGRIYGVQIRLLRTCSSVPKIVKRSTRLYSISK